MSEREIDITIVDPRLAQEPTQEEVKQFTDRIAQVRTRSHTNSRLEVPLPKELHGEWVNRMDVNKVHQYESMGFQIDTIYGRDNKLHNDGISDQTIIGDVVFMTIPKWQKDAYDREHRMASDANNNPKRTGKEISGLKGEINNPEEGILTLDTEKYGLSNEATSKTLGEPSQG